MKVQFEELSSEVKLKDEKLKKFKEDNRLHGLQKAKNQGCQLLMAITQYVRM